MINHARSSPCKIALSSTGDVYRKITVNHGLAEGERPNRGDDKQKAVETFARRGFGKVNSHKSKLCLHRSVDVRQSLERLANACGNCQLSYQTSISTFKSCDIYNAADIKLTNLQECFS